jgi:hypothetical protein
MMGTIPHTLGRGEELGQHAELSVLYVRFSLAAQKDGYDGFLTLEPFITTLPFRSKKRK